MNTRKVFSLDIGSTYTKGAFLLLDGRNSRVLARDSVPTTSNDIMTGAARVINTLLNRPAQEDLPSSLPGPVYISSSAKGGLRIAAIGIVPELTLQAARLAACSAGGKIVACCAYRLTREDMAAIDKAEPDIVLFTGGTDGGNEEYNRHNAEQLALSGFEGVVLYAGNAKQRDEVRRLLDCKMLVVTDNLLPEIGRLNIEPVRSSVHDIFLKRIVEGRGLCKVAALSAEPLKPTPLAVFDFLAAMSRAGPEWDDLVLIDIGGATTDFYSNTESFAGNGSSVLRGLNEPKLKRTVEGDLGLRINARSVYESERTWFRCRLEENGPGSEPFETYMDHIEKVPEHLPADSEERLFDSLLAGQCMRQAALRHAGRLEEVYTVNGKVLVQKGKDLGRVRTVIGSGGYLASDAGRLLLKDFFPAMRRELGATALIPNAPRCYIDSRNLIPLAANVVSTDPDSALALVVNGLKSAA